MFKVLKICVTEDKGNFLLVCWFIIVQPKFSFVSLLLKAAGEVHEGHQSRGCQV